MQTAGEHDAYELRAGRLTLAIARAFGPRIVGLQLDDGPNFLAVAPQAVLRAPDVEPYNLRGGHRLWVAPEIPAITYRPDDDPVVIEEIPGGASVTGPVDPVTGLRRTIELRPHADRPAVAVDHTIENHGQVTLSVAPWTLTQFRLGGRAYLPIAAAPSDPLRLLPDRSMVLWPYTRLDDPRFHVSGAIAQIEAAIKPDADGIAPGDPFKLGGPNRDGWLAYAIDGQLFVKRAAQAAGSLPDMGAIAQVYCDDRFIELETLGALVDLGPGGAIEHRETWELHTLPPDAGLEAIVALADAGRAA